MVQDKKNFSSSNKKMDATQDLDRKGQAKADSRTSSSSSSAGINKSQTGLNRDKDISSKRDVNSRK